MRAWWVLVLLAACTFDATPRGRTNIRCNPSDNRPCVDLGLTCEQGYCAVASAPYGLSLQLDRRYVKPGATVNATVTTDAGAMLALEVRVIREGHDAGRFEPGGTGFTFVNDPALADGEWLALAIGRDELGHVASAFEPFTVDTVPPVVTAANLLLTPRPLPVQPKHAITQMAQGAKVTVNWQTKEEATTDVRAFEPSGRPYGPLVFIRESEGDAGTVHTFTATLSSDAGTLAYQGALEVRLAAVDLAGNESSTVGGTVIVDTIPPFVAADAGGDLTLLRVPFGDRVDSRSRSELLIPAGVCAEPAAVWAFRPDTTTQLTPEGVSPLVPVSGYTQPLLNPNVTRVVLVLVDRAGNVGPRVNVDAVELVLMPASDNPANRQWLEKRAVLSNQRQARVPVYGPAQLGVAVAGMTSASAWSAIGSLNYVNDNALLTFDSERGRVVAWGGTPRVDGNVVSMFQAPPEDELDEMTEGTWLRRVRSTMVTRNLSNDPGSYGFAHDPRRNLNVRYEGTLSREAWGHDGERWLLLSTPSMALPTPSQRRGFAFTYSPELRGVALFGGQGVTMLADLWSLEGHEWTQRWASDGGAAPEPRMHPAFTPVEGIGLVVAGGRGVDGGALGDAWAFRGGAWSQLQPLQRPIESPVMISTGDPAAPVLMFDTVNGQAFASNGAPPLSFRGVPTWNLPGMTGAVWDPVGHQVVAVASGMTARRATDAGTWSLANADPLDEHLDLAAAAYEPRFDDVIVFGSTTDGGGWCLSRKTGWTPLDADGPQLRRGPAMARFDGGVVMMGGVALNGARLADRWHYTPTGPCAGTWQRSLPDSPTTRALHQGAETRFGAYFIGGQQGTPVSAERFDGTWTDLVLTGAVPPYLIPGVADDPRRGIVVAGGYGGALMPNMPGQARTHISADGTSFTINAPIVRRAGMRLLYDPGLEQLLVLGGSAVGFTIDDVGVIAPGALNVLPTVNLSELDGPGQRSNPAVTRDDAANRVLMFGGGGLLPSAWALTTTGQQPAVLYQISLDQLVENPEQLSYELATVSAVAGGGGPLTSEPDGGVPVTSTPGAELVFFTEGHFVPMPDGTSPATNTAPAASAALLTGRITPLTGLTRATAGQAWLTVGVRAVAGARAGAATVQLDSLEVRVKYRYGAGP